jgi:hypothetical protein
MEAVGYVFVSGSAIPSVLQVDGQQGRTIRSACGSASDLEADRRIQFAIFCHFSGLVSTPVHSRATIGLQEIR